ncbi:porin family protein [Jejubacter calystegiae]|uniref:Porin family protein n=1 Tax=Jejubacter calystegiae TaxID=2579935 RepID=A0A4P8YIU8_9ENTR|nr:outer membrane protein [Jejubacter calystegiae]QCT19628.1 porin family protein [Jejubacter calystegiae]
MKINAFASVLLLTALPLSVFASEGYYGAARLFHADQSAREMDSSSRPGVGQFVSGHERERFYNGAFAVGYQFGNGWRTEGEYVLRKESEYTSGSTAFPDSFNHMKTDVSRLMLNVYRDYQLGYGFALYGTAGIGIARVKVDGWQGNPSRDYADSTQDNFAWSLGAGVSYSPIERLTLDLGYRYIDMGKVESGYNRFTNARGLKDEQMKARLVSSEVVLGARYLF